METLIMKLLENPELATEIVSELTGKYKPIVYAVCKEFLGLLKDYVDNDEIYELRAKGTKKQFDAYKAVGFTDEQAIAFILNNNLQLVQNMNKISASIKE